MTRAAPTSLCKLPIACIEKRPACLPEPARELVASHSSEQARCDEAGTQTWAAGCQGGPGFGLASAVGRADSSGVATPSLGHRRPPPPQPAAAAPAAEPDQRLGHSPRTLEAPHPLACLVDPVSSIPPPPPPCRRQRRRRRRRPYLRPRPRRRRPSTASRAQAPSGRPNRRGLARASASTPPGARSRAGCGRGPFCPHA